MNKGAVLTRRESQIAEFIAWGAAKKEIAHELFISERTVENTARSIYVKTGVTKSTELAVWWFCTHFNISFDLSPVKRHVMACSLLLLVLFSEIVDSSILLRRIRDKAVSKIELRLKSAGRKVKDAFEYLPNL